MGRSCPVQNSRHPLPQDCQSLTAAVFFFSHPPSFQGMKVMSRWVHCLEKALGSGHVVGLLGCLVGLQMHAMNFSVDWPHLEIDLPEGPI